MNGSETPCRPPRQSRVSASLGLSTVTVRVLARQAQLSSESRPDGPGPPPGPPGPGRAGDAALRPAGPCRLAVHYTHTGGLATRGIYHESSFATVTRPEFKLESLGTRSGSSSRHAGPCQSVFLSFVCCESVRFNCVFVYVH